MLRGYAEGERAPTEAGQALERDFPRIAQPGEEPRPFSQRQLGMMDERTLAASGRTWRVQVESRLC